MAPALVQIARDLKASTLIVGHRPQSRFREFLSGSVAGELLTSCRDVDIRVVSTETDAADTATES